MVLRSPPKVPVAGETSLATMGVRVVIYANVNLRVSLRSMLEALGLLKAEGSLGAVAGALAPLDQVYRMQGTEHWHGL